MPDTSVDLLAMEPTELERFYGELRPAISSQLRATANAINAMEKLGCCSAGRHAISWLPTLLPSA